MVASQVEFNMLDNESPEANGVSRPISAIDLCCGAGGLTAGLLRAGIQVLGGVDNDAYAIATYQENFDLPVCPIDICTATAWDICGFFGTAPEMIDLIVGAPPWFGPRSTSSVDPKEERNQFLWSCARLIAELRPRVFLLEYPVPHFKLHTRIADAAVRMLSSSGYQIHQRELNALRYGVPQHRWRQYYVGQRDHHHLPFVWPVPIIDEGAAVPMWEAIRDLSPPSGMMACTQDPLHAEWGLTDLVKARLRAELTGDASSRSFGDTRRGTFRKVRRLHPDQPVSKPGISATFARVSGFNIFVHPFEDRLLTLREGARLQTFRDDFKFLPVNRRSDWTKLEELIGSATPPRLAAYLGQALADHLELAARLPAIGRRNVPPPSRSWGSLGQHAFQLLPTPSPELRHLLSTDSISAPVLVAQLLHDQDHQLMYDDPYQMDILATQKVWWSSRNRVDHAIGRYQDMLQLCELMGLCYEGTDHQLHVTPFGMLVFRLLDQLNEQNSRLLHSYAVQALTVCQLASPLHRAPDVAADNLFPCICIWRALLALDGWLSTEELHRVLLQVMTMEDLDAAILRIAHARTTQDDISSGFPAFPSSHVASQVHTWMSLASFGWTLLAPEYIGDAAWCYRVRPTATAFLTRAVRSHPRSYHFPTVHAYVTYIAQAAGVPQDVR